MIDASNIRGLEAIPAGDMPVRAPAPVDKWHPEQSAPIDIAIDADGQWFHEGAPIRRAGLVSLFASILRGEADGSYVLVTPAEKRIIEVADVPFVAVGISVQGVGRGQVITLVTNVGEKVAISADNPLRFAQSPVADGIALPYVRVRGRLEARVGRAVFPDLVGVGCVETHEEEQWFGVWSSGKFWPMMLADEACA